MALFLGISADGGADLGVILLVLIVALGVNLARGPAGGLRLPGRRRCRRRRERLRDMKVGIAGRRDALLVAQILAATRHETAAVESRGGE